MLISYQTQLMERCIPILTRIDFFGVNSDKEVDLSIVLYCPCQVFYCCVLHRLDNAVRNIIHNNGIRKRDLQRNCIRRSKKTKRNCIRRSKKTKL